MTPTKALWLAGRSKHITGTDMARLLGVSKYGGPMDVWLDKTGRSEPFAGTEQMGWGNRLERSILQYYSDTISPLAFPEPWTVIECPAHPLMAVSLDAIRECDGEPVDAKNIRFKSPDWGEPGSDQIPEDYLLQLAMQMLCTGTKRAHLAVLFGGCSFEHYIVDWIDQFDDFLVWAATAFWEEHVLTDTPPPLDGSKGWQKHVGVFKQNTPALRPADDDVNKLARRLHMVRSELDALELQKEEIQTAMKLFIGENAGVVGESWQATWKQAKDGQKIDWQAIAKEMGAPSTTIKRHTTTQPGSRRFLFTMKEENNE